MDAVFLKEHHRDTEFISSINIADSISEAIKVSDGFIFVKSPEINESIAKTIIELIPERPSYFIDNTVSPEMLPIIDCPNPRVMIVGWGASSQSLSTELLLISHLISKDVKIRGEFSAIAAGIINVAEHIINRKIIVEKDADVDIYVINIDTVLNKNFDQVIEDISPDYVILCVENSYDVRTCIEALKWRWGVGVDSIVVSNYFTYECYGKKYNILGDSNNIDGLASIIIKNKEIPLFKNSIDEIENICHHMLMKISLPDGVFKM